MDNSNTIPTWQWIEHALKGYIESIDRGYYKGMCDALTRSAMQLDIAKWLNQKDLVNLLPEFNPLWLTGNSKISGCYYWPIKDHESRITAFNRLINHYYSGEKKGTMLHYKSNV